MCQFFSAIVTRQGKVLFTEKDSHETVIKRAKLHDTDMYLRHWVRVELVPEGSGWCPLCVDETSTPAWFDEQRDDLMQRVMDVAIKVRLFWAPFKAVQAPAWAAYKAALAPAWATYKATQAPAWAAYEAAQVPALATYEAVIAPMWATYIEQLSAIEGYVGLTS